MNQFMEGQGSAQERMDQLLRKIKLIYKNSNTGGNIKQFIQTMEVMLGFKNPDTIILMKISKCQSSKVLNSDSSAQRHKYGEDQLGQLRYLRYFRECKSAW